MTMAQPNSNPPFKARVHLENGYQKTFQIHSFNVDDLGRLTLGINGINVGVFATGKWIYIELIQDIADDAAVTNALSNQ
jgi:hypothetical protein